MTTRRTFLQSLATLGGAVCIVNRSIAGELEERVFPYSIRQSVATRLFDGERCWSHPRAGAIPGAGTDGAPRVVMTMNTMHLWGSDVFQAMYGMTTNDRGKTWSEPEAIEALSPRDELIEGEMRPVAVSDFWPTWHVKSQTLLGTGHSVVYTPDWHIPKERPRHTTYATYDAAAGRWNPWRKLEMPDEAKFENCGAGCTQRWDLEDGTILLPVYFRAKGESSRVTVLRCSFDGKTLRYLSHGDELAVPDKTRGIGEPSLIRFNDEFFLTIRHDQRGYVTTGNNGLHFAPLREWTFDDGSPLGSYNTQTHWARHADGLYLVYTRRGANNDHVFRHRAPLFIGQVDPKRLCVIRESERILVPERGARLGNFGVTEVDPDTTWVTVSEWMQPKGVERHGADGSVWIAEIDWNKPSGTS